MDTGMVVKVKARTGVKGEGLSYAAFVGTLMEYCNGEGWDVVDVKHGSTGEVISVYSFSVAPDRRA